MQVLVFSEKKAEVDDIHEYLLLKGVEAVSIHGGKGIISHQSLRNKGRSMLYTHNLCVCNMEFYFIMGIMHHMFLTTYSTINNKFVDWLFTPYATNSGHCYFQVPTLLQTPTSLFMYIRICIRYTI